MAPYDGAMGSEAATTSGREALPLPPPQIAMRSGSVVDGSGPKSYANYLDVGRQSREEILALLGPDYSLEGKRMLDFGCGAGRTMRQFLPLPDGATLQGCDIYAKGADWANSNLGPQISAFASLPAPPLPLEDDSVDLIWALSVFTHITDEWSAWLLELRRVLAPGGLLIATFIGEEMESKYLAPGFGREQIGMNVVRHWADWENGGPVVLHSDWWLQRHWDPAFELVRIDERPRFEAIDAHRWGLFRKRDGAPTRADLELPDLSDRLERQALEHNVRQLQLELEKLPRLVGAGEIGPGELKAHGRRIARGYESTLSWRLTRPLRAVGGLLGRGRGRGSSDRQRTGRE